MIKELFPTWIIEKENFLEETHVENIAAQILITDGQDYFEEDSNNPNCSFRHFKEKLDTYFKTELNSKYNFKSVEVIPRFFRHFYPVGKLSQLEMHSDDLGDYGKKFIAMYYLEADPEGGGELELYDARWLNAQWKFGYDSYKIKPRANKLVVFPTFLWHKVNDYYSSYSPRMAIDVSIRVRN